MTKYSNPGVWEVPTPQPPASPYPQWYVLITVPPAPQSQLWIHLAKDICTLFFVTQLRTPLVTVDHHTIPPPPIYTQFQNAIEQAVRCPISTRCCGSKAVSCEEGLITHLKKIWKKELFPLLKISNWKGNINPPPFSRINGMALWELRYYTISMCSPWILV